LETIREATVALSSNEMQGRGTAQPGADRAARYLADQFAKLGLKPRGDASTYLQAINFKITQVMPESSVKAGDATLKHGEDFVVPPPYTSDQVDAAGGLVFAGYGIAAPELKHDDLSGLDLKGKIVVVVTGQPKNVDKAAWEKVAGLQKVIINMITRGAAGIIIGNVGTKDQPYTLLANYLARRNVAPAGAPEPAFKLPPFVLASDAALEKLFAGTGATYAQTLEKAANGENVSRELNKQASVTLRVKREQGASSNVVGFLEGADPKLKEEAVVYSAHYDAYGVGADGRVYPGAADNALGTAMILGIAEAFAKSPVKPRRSVIFLAVTGEEYGLLGAEHWVKNPTWPIEKVAANLNFDGIGTEIYGPVKRVVGIGVEHSDLG
ncbi:MAG: M28 family peptidase, partial [Pyrinomonadaceae bacterium]